jgi:hypothetical protein
MKKLVRLQKGKKTKEDPVSKERRRVNQRLKEYTHGDKGVYRVYIRIAISDLTRNSAKGHTGPKIDEIKRVVRN